MFLEFLKGFFHRIAAAGSLENLFDQKSTGAVCAQWF
jgi:hypothetical protein